MNKEDMVDSIRRVVVHEERERLAGMVEFYISTLGDSPAERTVIHLLKGLIKTIEKNKS